jgi:hypothetical protein
VPRLSLYHPTKSNDYRYFDRNISQVFTIGATDLYIHKYAGPTNQGPSIDATQPQYETTDPTNIQDLLFLENRDRSYDPNIYRLRGHYNVQNLDFDLSQFGLFLNNDIIFITVHYNDMIDILGRKLIVGDVLELPHLLDYNPLNESIPTALRRMYQVTDGNYASEGFSPTWYPHIWRIKCEPLVDSQEFSQILAEPLDMDNYLGVWTGTEKYPAGYTLTYGDKNYITTQEVPIGIAPPNSTYWKLDPNQNLKDILSTYNKNIAINNAALEEAHRLAPLSGYDNSNLYVVPTVEEQSVSWAQPSNPISIIIASGSAPITATGTVSMMRSANFKNASPVIRLSRQSIQSIWDMTADMVENPLDAFLQMSLEAVETPPTRIGTGSGAVSGDSILTVMSMGTVTGPYGTADNTYATADANPAVPGFKGTISTNMDYRADCDPAYQYIARSSPRSFGYTVGYLTGTGAAPNGYPVGSGITFPHNPQNGDYFLRIDYLPQLLFRWNGAIWVRIAENVRTETGMTLADKSQMSGFINNEHTTQLTDGSLVPQRQALSTILTMPPLPFPPKK